jgi:hypothetical protein
VDGSGGEVKYRKRPIVVEAFQTSEEAIYPNRISRLDVRIKDGRHEIYNKLQDSWIKVVNGDWIIRGVQGELYPCTDDVFQETYEAVDDNFWIKATNEIFQKNVEATKQMAELAGMHLVVERKDFWGIMEGIFKSCGVTPPTAGDQFADLATNAKNLKTKVDALLEVARAAQGYVEAYSPCATLIATHEKDHADLYDKLSDALEKLK